MSSEIGPSFTGYLIDRGFVSNSDISRAEEFSAQNNCSLYAALRALALVESQILAGAIASFHNIPLLDQDDVSNTGEPLSGLSLAFLRDHNVVPIRQTEDDFTVAIEDPADHDTLNAVRLALRKPINPVVASAEDIQAIIDRLSSGAEAKDEWREQGSTNEVDSDVEHLRDIALETPVVRFVNQLIEDAIRRRATDIHIEPFANRFTVRLRVDGMLQEVSAPPQQLAKAVVSRIKILSGLDIAERRLPQDGRSRVQIGHHRLDLRVATMPTIGGEAIAIRLLDNVRRALDFAKLGFSARDEDVIRKNLGAPYGLILVTGPTGSGKTTTLATALSELNQTHRKILTIEDPIEYEIEGVNQTQAKPEIGLTFARALRSFLRHDPDVVMVGEMRDGETASIGVHAALTGHLVLTTLHTNSAVGTIPRLMDMGVDPYLLASTLRCVVAQRLVRVLCPHCKLKETSLPDHNRTETQNFTPQSLSPEDRWVAPGCDRCSGTGYHDRMVIAEVLGIDDNIREMIRPDVEPREIERVAVENGMKTMFADGLSKCVEGLTTESEVRRAAIDV